jgi:hypothetical protein
MLAWEEATLKEGSGDTAGRIGMFHHRTNRWLSVDPSRTVTTSSPTFTKFESFQMIEAGNGIYCFKSWHGTYLTALGSGCAGGGATVKDSCDTDNSRWVFINREPSIPPFMG